MTKGKNPRQMTALNPISQSLTPDIHVTSVIGETFLIKSYLNNGSLKSKGWREFLNSNSIILKKCQYSFDALKRCFSIIKSYNRLQKDLFFPTYVF